MMSRSSVLCSLFSVLIPFLILSCDSSTSADVDRTLTVVAGPDQTAGSASTLLQPIVVRVMDAKGNAVPGAEVHWRVIEGGGSVSDVSTLTDSAGKTQVRWTLGADVGRQLLLATSGSATITLAATAIFQIASVAAGFHHTCAVSTAGDAYCWGLNQQGQLGDGTETNSRAPVRVNSVIRFVQVAAAWSHTCGLSQLGEAYCWGDNTAGQLGIGTTATRSDNPVRVTGDEIFAQLSVGFVHSCAVTAAGDAVCWGSNAQSQLGTPTLQASRTRITGMQFRKISTGEFHTCAIRNDGTGTCWGLNSSGEIGNGAAAGATIAIPTPVAGTVRFSEIAAGVRHTCAIATDARAFCWGRNAIGETGQVPFFNANIPVAVPSADNLTAIGTGNTHTCALRAQQAYCWGSLLGNGTTGTSMTPVLVSSSLVFSSISVGYDHTCGVVAGEVWCWGSNSDGQLGQAGPQFALSPVRVVFR